MTTRLTESQLTCLWAMSIGSKGSGSNKRTLDSLRRRGLASVRYHQGDWLWETTAAGETLLDSSRNAQ